MKKLLLLLCLTLLILGGYGQDQHLIDSLQVVLKTAKNDTLKVNIMSKICQEKIASGEFTGARKYAEEIIALSEKIDFKNGLGKSYYQIAITYANTSDYMMALKYFQKALAAYEQSESKDGIAKCLHSIGNIYQALSEFPKALDYYHKSLAINEKLNNRQRAAMNYQGIGNVYWYLSDYNLALDNFQTALTINEQLKNKSECASNLGNIGNVYHDLGDYARTIEYCQRAITIYKEMEDAEGLATNFGNLGETYLRLSDYFNALEYSLKALNIAEEIGDKYIISMCNCNLGEIYRKQGRHNDALKYLSKALAVGLEIGALDCIKEAYHQFAVLDSAMNNFRGAYESHKRFMQINDSMFNVEKNKKITELQLKYEFEKIQDSTKAEQTKKDALAQKELQRQKLVRNGFMGGFAIVLLFAAVFFTQRNKIKIGKRRSDDLLLNILPSEVAEELKAKGSAEAKHFDEVTVMFTDFKGFTQISEKLSPAELVTEIDTCFKTFDNIISKHNIEKIKTIGDSYMCAGGLPVANKTHATDVVKAALEIQKFMLEHLQQRKSEDKEVFEIRIGIHTGPVVAGIVGVKKFAYDIWGDTVNIASRMESSGEAGKVNISGSTYELVKDKFNCIQRGKIQAKNKGEIDMYFVESDL